MTKCCTPPCGLCFFGVVFLITFCALFGIGLWMLCDTSVTMVLDILGMYGNLKQKWYISMATDILLATGGLCGLITLIFFLVARKLDEDDSCCPVIIGITIVIVIVIALLQTGVALVVVYNYQLTPATETHLQTEVWSEYQNETSPQDFTSRWNDLQIRWRCCGSRRYHDYRGSAYESYTGYSVPWTCCVLRPGSPSDPVADDVIDVTRCRGDATGNVTQSDYLHTTGCYGKMYKLLLKTVQPGVLGICIIASLLQTIGVLSGCMYWKCCSKKST